MCGPSITEIAISRLHANDLLSIFSLCLHSSCAEHIVTPAGRRIASIVYPMSLPCGCSLERSTAGFPCSDCQGTGRPGHQGIMMIVVVTQCYCHPHCWECIKAYWPSHGFCMGLSVQAVNSVRRTLFANVHVDLGRSVPSRAVSDCALHTSFDRHSSAGVCSSVCVHSKLEWQHEVPEGAVHGATDSICGAPAVAQPAKSAADSSQGAHQLVAGRWQCQGDNLLC